MREHPIPQDITGYRFHIIGSMTLKQFAEVAAGVIVALIIYKTNLFLPIKWVLILLSIGLGAGAAFLPIEERPLDHWIATFFKVLYKPTKFFWERTATIPEPFLYKPQEMSQELEAEVDLTPARRERIKEYLHSVNSSKTAPDVIEDQARIQEILQVFQNTPTGSPSKKTTEKPDLSVRVRKLRTSKKSTGNLRTETVVYAQQPVAPVYEDTHSQTSNQLELLKRQQLIKNQKQALSAEMVAQDIAIPELEQVDINAHDTSDEEIAYAQNVNETPSEERAYIEPVKQADASLQTSIQASYNADLPFPSAPSEPNKLVGMVLSPNNDLITSAIVEVRDQSTGNISRAVKTNALGQFFITTPLKNGQYVLVVDKDGYQFEPQALKLEGKVVPPIEIRSA